MSSRRDRRVRVAVLALALAGCKLPTASGTYEPQPLRGVPPELPVTVRNVAVLDARVVSPANGGHNTSFSDDEMTRIRAEMQAAIERDVYSGGPFRRPAADEPSYQLDAWIERLSMPLRNGYVPVAMIGWFMLGLPFVLGVPNGVVGKDGEAVFHLYAPDGTLVLEEYVESQGRFAVGLYYGEKPVGEAAAPLVRRFKRAAVFKRELVLAGIAVPMRHAPDGTMLRARARRIPYFDPTLEAQRGPDGEFLE